MSEIALPRSFETSIELSAPPEAVFDFLDDFTQIGAHMMRRTWMMAGSRMNYEFGAARGRAIGARVRITGAFLGIPIEIEERVTDRDRPAGKAWRTIGVTRMLIMGAYRMGFTVHAIPGGSRLQGYIDYVLPQRGFAKVAGWLFAGTYARWCVRGMLSGAVARFGVPGTRDPANFEQAAAR